MTIYLSQITQASFKMIKPVVFCLSILMIPSFLQAQEKDAYDKKYEWKTRQEILYGVYIPKDVNEALLQLNKLIDEESKAKFKSLPEAEVNSKLFFSLGRWITYNWSLYDGSRLAVYMQNMGIYHPDDMAGFIITVYHRSLNQKPLEIKQLMKFYQEKNQKEKEKRQKRGTILFEEKRQLEKPEEGKNGGN